MNTIRKKYVQAPHNCMDYFTSGKNYEVLDCDGGACIIDDCGCEVYLDAAFNWPTILSEPERDDNPQNSQQSDNNTPDGSNPQKTQIGGNHYTDMAIQPLTFAMANKLDACQTKIVKYTCRKKGNRLEDLEKARHVLDWYIDWIKQNEI